MPYWPTPAQEALLRASDPRGQSDPSHWLHWRSSIDFDDLDGPSQQLIPLLYANLNCQGIADANLGRYKGFYRRTWYLNQLLFSRVEEVLGAFHEGGIPTLLVGGAALVHRSYRDPGLRRVDRGTIVVPPDLAAAAVRRLRAGGWQLVGRSSRCLSWILRGGPDRQGMVLQGHVLPGFSGGAADADFWDAAIPTPFRGVPTRILGPADQLIDIAAAAILGQPMPVLGWAADLVSTVHVEGGQVDWDRLVRMAARCRMTIAVREALAYVHGTLDVPIPARVLSALESIPTASPERMLYQGRTAGGLPPWRAARAGLREWKGGACSLPGALTALSRYFQDLWYVPRLWQLPGHAILRATRKAVGRPRVLSPTDFAAAAAWAGDP